MDNKPVKTTDYSQFKQIFGNRELNPTNLKLIMRSILEMDLLAQNPIQVNENMEIVDGQHRLEVAKRLSVPVYYVIIEGGNLRDVIRLNAARRLWANKDYLMSYIKLGNQQYVALKEFMEEYQVRLSIAIHLLMGIKMSQGGHSELGRPMDIFRKGEFKVRELTYAQDVANNLLVLAERSLDDCWKERGFVNAFQILSEKVSFREFLKQVEKSKMVFNHRKNAKGYLQLFEEIVNFGKSNATHLY